jgi:hypothetical protein
MCFFRRHSRKTVSFPCYNSTQELTSLKYFISHVLHQWVNSISPPVSVLLTLPHPNRKCIRKLILRHFILTSDILTNFRALTDYGLSTSYLILSCQTPPYLIVFCPALPKRWNVVIRHSIINNIDFLKRSMSSQRQPYICASGHAKYRNQALFKIKIFYSFAL